MFEKIVDFFKTPTTLKTSGTASEPTPTVPMWDTSPDVQNISVCAPARNLTSYRGNCVRGLARCEPPQPL